MLDLGSRGSRSWFDNNRIISDSKIAINIVIEIRWAVPKITASIPFVGKSIIYTLNIWIAFPLWVASSQDHLVCTLLLLPVVSFYKKIAGVDPLLNSEKVFTFAIHTFQASSFGGVGWSAILWVSTSLAISWRKTNIGPSPLDKCPQSIESKMEHDVGT